MSYTSDGYEQVRVLEHYALLFSDQFGTLNLVSDGEWAMLSQDQREILIKAWDQVARLM